MTDSKYGRNGTEITINNSSNYITGSAGNSVDAGQDVGTTNDYRNTQGILASSVGNIYGIYDLSGGIMEYVAAYYKDGSISSDTSTFATGISDEYSTAYEGTNAKTSYKIGDATYETKGWNLDGATFAGLNYTFFARGGNYANGFLAGVFYFSETGNTSGCAFRVCLCVM